MSPKDPPKHPEPPEPGKFPPDAESAVPSGSPDVYDPNYVPPAADPAHDESAAEVPPGELYPPSQQQTYSSEWDGYPAPAPETSDPYAAEGFTPPVSAEGFPTGAPAPSGMEYGPPNPDDAPIFMADPNPGLQQAVGAPSPRARKRARTQPGAEDGDEPKRSKRVMIVATLSIIGGLGIATLVFLGRANAGRYAISCSSSHAIAMQGRSFPPWGTKALNGPEWAPIALPANAECQPRETDDVAELGKWYLEMLVDRATVTLTARDILDLPVAGAVGNQPAVTPLDAVSAELDQALLLARDPDKRDQRKEITRLQGDVLYWRAAARLRDASTVLIDASKQFDAANAQRPRHATDSAAWSTFLHHLADELRAGPNGVVPLVAPAGPTTPTTATQPGVPVPVGTALPVEDSGSGEAPAPPDAGVPSGGVMI